MKHLALLLCAMTGLWAMAGHVMIDGSITGTEMRSGATQIDALVPLSNMFGYATDLRSRTQGRANYSMEPSHYVPLPKGLQEELLRKRGRY